jgi:hypothetical protein
MTPTFDPNWFYSSLAQCAASVVGLLGAVLVSRLLDHLNIIRTNRRALLADFAGIRNRIEKSRRYIEGYSAFLECSIPRMRSALEQGGVERTVTVTEWASFSSMVSGSSRSVPINDQILADQERDLQVCKRLLDVYMPAVSIQTLNEIGSMLPRFEAVISEIPKEVHNHVEPHAYDLSELNRRCSEYRKSLVPWSVRSILLALIWIGGFSVLWPLSYLSSGEAKWLLLSFFGAGLAGLCGFFLWMMEDLKRAGRLDIPEKERVRR